MYPYTAERRDVLGNTSPEDREISQRRGFCTPRPKRFARERSPSCSISQGRCQIFLFPASNLSICVFSKIWSRNGSLIYCGYLKEFKSIFYPGERKQYEEGINLYFSLSGLKVAIWSGRERQIEISCSDSLWAPSTFANWTITILYLWFVTRIGGQCYLKYLNINFNINFDSVP